MKRLFLLLVLVGGFALTARAQYGLLIVNPEARSMAMGGVTATTISSSNTIFNNPSLVSFANSPFQISTSYSGARSREFYSLSAYYQFLTGGAIQAGWRSYHYNGCDEMSFELGYSRPIARLFSVAITGRYIHCTDDTEKKINGLAADLSASCRIPFGQSSLLVGAKLNNLGVYLSGSDDTLLPIQLTGGVGFNWVINESHSLLFAADTDYCFNPSYSRGAQVGVGMEYEFMQLLLFRAGYNYGQEGTIYPSYGSVGAGLHFLFFRVDFSYLIASKNSMMRNVYTVNVGLNF